MAEQPTNEMTQDQENRSAHILTRNARQSEQVARQLAREAMSQWQKAISGVLAVPTAVALSTAANALYIAAFIERGFEAFQETTEAVSREMEQQLRTRMRGGNGNWGMSREPS